MRRLIGTAGAVAVIAAGLIAGGCSSTSSTSSLAATTVTASGALAPVSWPGSALASKFDCFYVHPTDSLAVTKTDSYVADEQGAPLSRACQVWAPSVLRRLVVAVLVGGNLQVPDGKTVGATFTKVPLCTASTQTGCAIAFSPYPSQPPPDSESGRPGPPGSRSPAWPGPAAPGPS
jgi:hypothetical protein